MKFSMISISFFLVILFLTHAFVIVPECPTPVPAQYKSLKPGKVVAAYFASWDKYGRYKVADIEPIARTLTHVIYAFAKPNPKTGMCELPDPWADIGANFQHRKKVGGHFGQLLQLKKKYPHLKILLSVGGGSYSKYLVDIAQRNMIKQFARSVVSLLDRYDYEYEHSDHKTDHVHTFEYSELFDGIDVDWEWSGITMQSEHVDAYHELIRHLSQMLSARSKVQGKKSLLTCAVEVQPKIIETSRLADIAKHVDWFHVMAYDFGGVRSPGVSLNAPICNQWSGYSIDGSIDKLIHSGISPKKLVLGIPLYGQVYDKTKERIGSPFERTEKTGSFRYDQIKNLYIDNPDCYTKWHNTSKVPFAYCPSEEVFVSYDDPQSVKIKANYARQKCLNGVFFWRLSGDDDNHSLVKAVK